MNLDNTGSIMNPHDAKKRLFEEREKSVNEWIAKTDAYIEAYTRIGGVPNDNPEELKRGIKESRDALMSALNEDVPYPFGPAGSQMYLDAERMFRHAIYIANKASEAYFQLRYEIGDISADSKIEEKDLDSLLPPPNWNGQHRYIFGDKVLRNGRIRMCVKEHESKEFIDNPGYWRDVVAELSQADKEKKKALTLSIPEWAQKAGEKAVTYYPIIRDLLIWIKDKL